ncbi:RNA-directed DNA polymerase, eukaryota, reverse transcriptase zinc-binding domain protein [Tanacetum coccineum]
MENDSKNNQTGKGLLRGSKSKDVDHKAVGKDGLPLRFRGISEIISGGSGMVDNGSYRHDHIEGNPSSKLGFESLDIVWPTLNASGSTNNHSHQAKEVHEGNDNPLLNEVRGNESVLEPKNPNAILGFDTEEAIWSNSNKISPVRSVYDVTDVGEAVRSDFYEVEQVNLENEEEVLKHDKSQEAFNLASDHTMKDKGKNEGWASNEAKAFQSSTKASFAHVVNNSNTSENSPKVNFREITNAKKTDKCDFILPVEAIHAIRHKYENSLVGFFVGKKVAFQLVKNYVTNTWAKFGFQRIMSDDEGLLYFQFKTSKGMEQVLEHGTWLIRSIPLILTKWTPNLTLHRDKWVNSYAGRFHQISCATSWGRVGYARALIEVHAEKDLKKEIIMAIPNKENESEEPTMITFLCYGVGNLHINQGKKHVETKVTKGFKVNNKPTVRYQVVRDNNKGHNTIAVSKDGIEVNNVFEKLYDLTELVESTKEDNEGTASLEPLRNTGKNQISLSARNGMHSRLIRNLHQLLVYWFRILGLDFRMCLEQTTARYFMGWNRNDVDVVVISQDDQVMHARVWMKLERKEVFCSFVYAHNKYTHRRSLWSNLSKHKVYIRNRPWFISGDFNASLFLEESTASGSKVDIAVREFRECVDDIENLGEPSQSVLCIPTVCKTKPKPFKFFNILTSHEKFLDVVKQEWAMNVSGFHMYQVVKKLKNLKKPFRKLLYDKGNIHANVNRLRTELDSIQLSLDTDPFNIVLREREASCIVEFNQAILTEERFLKQKAKIQWLKEGDSNSSYFHKVVKSRVSRNVIIVVVLARLVGETRYEIKYALFSIGDDKSPGPDGFSAAFFKEAWIVIGQDIYNAVREFFRNGTMLKEINHTIIALLPKSKKLYSGY